MDDLVRLLPTIVVGVAAVVTAPVWPWSRGWGWNPFGMVMVVLGTIVLFTLSVEPT